MKPGPEYSSEQIDFINKNFSRFSYKGMLEEINKIGPEHTFCSLKAYYARHGIRSGIDCRFKKGQPAHNKGVPMSESAREKCLKIAFKKGHVPWDKAEIGDETIVHRQGEAEYVYVKVAQPDVWRPKAQLIWEQHHGRKLEPKEIVVFMDGNTFNFNIENLCCMKKGELVFLNHEYSDFDSPEERQVYLDLVRIRSKLKEMTGK